MAEYVATKARFYQYPPIPVTNFPFFTTLRIVFLISEMSRKFEAAIIIHKLAGVFYAFRLKVLDRIMYVPMQIDSAYNGESFFDSGGLEVLK